MKRRKRMLDDLSEDIREHLERETQDNIERGMPPDAARTAALRKFGNVTRVAEDARAVWRLVWLEQLLQDIVYAFRSMRKFPGFTAVVILTLALGIGANTAIFSVVEGVVLAPLSYHQPDRLVMIYQSDPRYPRVWISYLNFRDWQRSARSFEGMAAFHGFQGYDITSPGAPEHLTSKVITSGFFHVLGLKLVLGREFTAEENQPGGAPAVILSNGLWKSRFKGSTDVLGKTTTLNGVDYTVVGVAPAPPILEGDADVYTPMGQSGPQFLHYRAPHQIACVARLKPGVSIAQAQAEMSAIQKNLDELYPIDDRDLGAYVVSLKADLLGDTGGLLLLLLGAVGLVLLIACANVANLVLARSASRTRELAVRSALGASRMRLIRQLLTESVLLSLIGGSLGLVLAAVGVKPLLATLGQDLPRVHEIGLNLPVLGFAGALAVIVGILFGTAPALKNSKADLQTALKEGGRTSSGSRHRVQKTLVVVQMSLTLVLLTGAGLLLRTLWSLSRVDPGFDPQHLISFKVGVSPSLTKTVSGTRIAYQQLIERIRAAPGVESAEFTSVVPLSGESGILPFWIGPNKPDSLQGAPRMLEFMTGPDYLKTMGIPLLRGRFLTADDTTHTPCVMVVDEQFVRLYLPRTDPLGQTIYAGFATFGPCSIVGVVGHVRHWGLDEPGFLDMGEAYLPVAQDPDTWVQANYAGFSVMVRTALDPVAVMPAITYAVQASGREQPVYKIESMPQMVEDSMSTHRFPMVLLGGFAGLALLLAALGIYGVISYSVTQRMREIGIRMVLGARRQDVFRMIVGQGLRLAATGLIIGAVFALILGRLLKSFSDLLYGVRSGDPATLITVAAISVVVAFLACYIPARRATRVDPMSPLRAE
jgi:predicted permease